MGELSHCALHLRRARNLHEYVRLIRSDEFDLIIFDILLPQAAGGGPIDSSEALVDELFETVNEDTRSVALTAMQAPEYHALLKFNQRSIPVLIYDEEQGLWRGKLRSIINTLSKASKLDFLILCALDKEAEGFSEEIEGMGDWRTEAGAMRWRPIEVAGRKGGLLVFPRMGMTIAALTTSKAIEFFRPRLIAMSGICAGVEGEADMLDIIVPEIVWDHRLGKLSNDGFKHEFYGENVDPELISLLKADWEGRKGEFQDWASRNSRGRYSSAAVFGPVASGSVVVANAQAVKDIEAQQRKVVGIEMEFAAVFTACSHSSVKPKFFGAKAVVDFADHKKDDLAHERGVVTAARYISLVLPKVFEHCGI